MAYVYRHIRLDTNQPFYIGIAKNDDTTYSRAHYKYKSKRNKIWLDIINKTSYEVEILFEDLTWEEACQKEIEFITLYGRVDLKTGTLANMTKGGDGMVGVVRSEEYRLQVSERQKNGKAYWFGKKLSKEHKEKIAAHLWGRKVSEETRDKLRNALKGEKNPNYGKVSHRAMKVIDTETNIIYDSIMSCQKLTNYKKLQEKLSGKRKNLTPIVYLKDYNNNSNDI
jgi:plasmid stability protein